MTDQKTPTTLQRLAELMDLEYPDLAPPKQHRDGFYLYETLNDDELDQLRRELTEAEVTP